MKKNIVRIETELFKAGELVRGHLIDIYMKPPDNFVWYPKQPKFTILDDPDGAYTCGHPGEMLRFDEGGLFFRFDALGAECDGFAKGDIDFLMTTKPAAELFAEDFPHFAHQAQMSLEAFRDRANWATLVVYWVDVDEGRVEFYATLELEEATLDEPIDGEPIERAA